LTLLHNEPQSSCFQRPGGVVCGLEVKGAGAASGTISLGLSIDYHDATAGGVLGLNVDNDDILLYLCG